MWDTEHNSGVLIYVQLVDRRIEIVADRGINAKVPQHMGRDLPAHGSGVQGKPLREGALDADEKSRRCSRGISRRRRKPDELSDKPVVL